MHERRSILPSLSSHRVLHLHFLLFFSAFSALFIPRSAGSAFWLRLFFMLALLAPGSAVQSFADPAPTPLFNGLDLTRWQTTNGHTDNWSVADGILIWNGGEGARWIATDITYSDFELNLEFNYAPGANSGVFFRTPLTKTRPAYEGNEIQIVDEVASKNADTMTEHRRMGALYTVQPPLAKASAPPNQWHRFTLRCHGSHCKVTINDTVVIDHDLTAFSDDLKKEHPGRLRTEGHIGLQSKPESKIKFRNLTIKKLKPPAKD